MNWKERLLKKKEDAKPVELPKPIEVAPIVMPPQPKQEEEAIDEIESALLQSMFRTDEDVRIFLAAERGRLKYNMAVKANLEK